MPPADVSVTVFGIPNVGVFVTLKNSPRNCRRLDSVIGNSLNTDTSKFRSHCERKMLAPPLPYVFAAGTANTLVPPLGQAGLVDT